MFEPHGLFYGSNARSGNPILADRRSHMNSNGFVLGTSGGGKSFTVKQEIAGMFLNRDDEVIVIDPEREYLALAAAFGGQIIQISAGTGTRVNPMDIVLEDDSASDPVKDKTNNVAYGRSYLVVRSGPAVLLRYGAGLRTGTRSRTPDPVPTERGNGYRSGTRTVGRSVRRTLTVRS